MTSNDSLITEFQKYQSIIIKYSLLSTKKELSERDAEDMGEILEEATNNSTLEFFLNEADHIVAHQLKHINSEYMDQQQKELKRIFKNKGIPLQNLSKQYSEEIQYQLSKKGLYNGNIDGLIGTKTKKSLKTATEKVQKYLKHEKIYTGDIDGYCNQNLENAIIKYKENFEKEHLKNNANDILELSFIVCAKIPCFLDNDKLIHEKENYSDQRIDLNNQKENTPKIFHKFKKISTKSIFRYMSFPVLGTITAVISTIYLHGTVTQWNTTNIINPYKTSSEIQPKVYKEENNNSKLKSQNRKYSQTISVPKTITNFSQKIIVDKNTSSLNREVINIHKIANINDGISKDLYLIENEKIREKKAKEIERKAKNNIKKAKKTVYKINNYSAFLQSDSKIKQTKQTLSEAIQFSFQTLQISSEVQQMIAENHKDITTKNTMLSRSKEFLQKANQWEVAGQNLYSIKNIWGNELYTSLDI